VSQGKAIRRGDVEGDKEVLYKKLSIKLSQIQKKIVFLHLVSNKKRTNMTKEYNPEQINYALVEGIRPPMYSAMKYWGRKPHNIWNDYIQHYCPEDGVVLDPFVGSGITAFEGAKLGRKVIATDLNPLSSFVIETMTAKFDEEVFAKSVDKIKNLVEQNDVYKRHYTRHLEGDSCVVYNYIWEKGEVSKVRLKSEDAKKSYSLDASQADMELAYEMQELDIPFWFPTDAFPKNPSINQNFIDKIKHLTTYGQGATSIFWLSSLMPF